MTVGGFRMTAKRAAALLLCLALILGFAGCAEEAPQPVDVYRASLEQWDTLPQEKRDEVLRLHSLQYREYMERLSPLTDLIFAQLSESALRDDLRQRPVAQEFAQAFLYSAWVVNVPDAPVVSAQIVEHPDSTLATQGDRAKYDELAVELTDELGNRYLVCFNDWTAMLYQDGTLLESHYYIE